MLYQRFQVLFALAIIAFCLNAPAYAQPMPSDGFAIGIEALEQGNFDAAHQAFSQAIEATPERAAAYGNRCLVNLYQHRYESAIADCTQALQRDTANLEPWLNRGLAHYRLTHYEAAIADYETVLQRHPNHPQALYNRGLAQVALQNYRGAIADYSQVLFHHSNLAIETLAEVYTDRGLAQFMLAQTSGVPAQLEAAIADLDQAIALNPNADRPYFNRGCICHQTGDIWGALENFNATLTHNQHHAAAYQQRGLIYHRLGLQDAALQNLRRAAHCFQMEGAIAEYQKTLHLIEQIQRQPSVALG
jgi:tetratricopeptide (TPR) repeat protein